MEVSSNKTKKQKENDLKVEEMAVQILKKSNYINNMWQEIFDSGTEDEWIYNSVLTYPEHVDLLIEFYEQYVGNWYPFIENDVIPFVCDKLNLKYCRYDESQHKKWLKIIKQAKEYRNDIEDFGGLYIVDGKGSKKFDEIAHMMDGLTAEFWDDDSYIEVFYEENKMILFWDKMCGTPNFMNLGPMFNLVKKYEQSN